MNIIDSHVHIYPEKIAVKASQNIGNFYNMDVKYDGTINVLIKQCQKNNIDLCLINSVATIPEQVISINNFIAESVRMNPSLFIGLCTLHPFMSLSEISEEIDRVKKLGLIGIKLHPDFQKFSIDDKNVYKIYQAAEGVLPILFHTGDKRFNYSNPKRLLNVLNDFPNLTAIAAHFGGWSEWNDAVKYLTGKENLYVDTSSSFYSMTEKEAVDIIKSFGAEKILFGSDYPMWDVTEELEFFMKLDLTQKEKNLILFENAKRILGTDL